MSRAKKAKHQVVFEALSRDITSGRYRPGQKFPSEAALVNRFNVSRITAARAVHDLQAQGLVERFAGSGTYVRGLDDGSRTGLVFGLIIPDLGTTEIFEPICQGIASARQSAGHALLWPHAISGIANAESQALQLCEQCIARQVDGVFFAPVEMTAHSTEVNRQVVSALRKANIPTVFLDRRPEGADERRQEKASSPRDRGDLVSIDNQRAGFLATEHLLKCGARDIGFLAYPGQASSVAGRIAGYRQALDKAGQVFLVHNISRVELPPAAESCNAFVCANDHIAGHVMQALLEKRIRVPQDVRIVGIDDVNYAALLPVPLTTVHQPCREIGETALQLLLDRIGHPRMPARDVLLDCELVVRQSCGFRVTI